MALFHVATSEPSKAEVIAAWIPTQPWGPSAETETQTQTQTETEIEIETATGLEIERLASFHFDDPDGRVGMETHLIRAGADVFQVPLTYRDAPLAGADGSLIARMEHTALGTRFVYDGLGDDLYRTMLAAASLTGQGQALGMARYDDRWHVAPSTVILEGGGWGERPVAVDGFADPTHDASGSTIINDRFELTLHRRPAVGPPPTIGLTATWPGQGEPVVLTSMRERSASR